MGEGLINGKRANELQFFLRVGIAPLQFFLRTDIVPTPFPCNLVKQSNL